MGYFGMIELVIVLAFAAGWGAVELVGRRLDNEKAAKKGTGKTTKRRKPAAKKRRR